MPLFAAILAALAPPFLLILLGGGLKRARVLHPTHVPILNGLVVQVTLPALVLHGLLNAPHLSSALALPVLAAFGAEAAAAAVIYTVGRAMRLPPGVLGALLLVGVYGNTGFIGYPLTLALVPAQFPETILIDQFAMNIPMYLSAALLGAQMGGATGTGGGGRREAVLRFLRSPLFGSAILGIALRLAPVPPGLGAVPVVRAVGAVLGKCLEYLGQGTTPLVLLALGVALRPGAAGGRVGALSLACACKLLVSPLAMWGMCRLLGLHGEARMDGVLEAAMPASVMASVLAGQNDMEGDFAVGVVFVSTVLSALTVPLLLTWLR